MPSHRLLRLKGEKCEKTSRPPLLVVETADETADEQFANARMQSRLEFAARGEPHPGFDMYRQDIDAKAGDGVQPTLTLEGVAPVGKKTKSNEDA